MKRTVIGAALSLALATSATAATPRHVKHHVFRAPQAPVGFAIGRSALPASGPRRFGAVLNSSNCSPNFVTRQVPSAAQWNSAFLCGFPAIGGLLGGPLGLPASTVFSAPLNIPPGIVPTTPANGDIWATPAGVFIQVNGATVGPLGTGGGGGGGSNLVVGTTPIIGGTNGDFEVNNAGVLGEIAPTGSGNVVLSTAPTLIAPNLGTPSSVNLANAADLPLAVISGLGTGVPAALAIPPNTNGGMALFPTTTIPGGIPNVSGSAQNTTANCNSGSTTVTLAGAVDFANGQGIALEHCGATFSGTAPTGLAVLATVGTGGQGPTGSTTYAYQIACVDDAGGVGIATAAVTITNGNATLGVITQGGREIAFNSVTWATTCAGVAIWRSASGGAFNLLGVFNSAPQGLGGSKLADSGLPTVTIPWIPATPPTAALNDRLVTTIASGGGTTSIVTAAAPTNSETGALARHDDTAALLAFLSASADATLAAGTFNVENLTIPTNVGAIKGAGAGVTSIVGWNSLTPTLTATAMPLGFSLSGVQITPLAAGNAIGLSISSTTDCSLNNDIFGGSAAVFLSFDTGCKVTDNNFGAWYRAAIVDVGGVNTKIAGNILSTGLVPNQSVGIFAVAGNGEIFTGNSINGGEFFGIDLQSGVSSVVSNNTVLNSLREALHLSVTSTGNSIEGNYINGGTSSIDYCISVSDDESATGVLSGNQISGNYMINCGISAIAISQEATGAILAENTISGNTIINVNADLQGSVPAIALNGAGVKVTYINGNTFVGKLNFTFNVQETSSVGTPISTQVGSNYGEIGPSGYSSLIGTGSVVLSGGSSGL
jgi:hypothetical protein